jgi:hypothetical protein
MAGYLVKNHCPTKEISPVYIYEYMCAFLIRLTQVGARGDIVCWGSMPQDGWSRVRVPMISLDFF